MNGPCHGTPRLIQIRAAPLGLIIKDPDVRNKRLWAGSPSLRVSMFPPQELRPGQSLTMPPASIMIYRGDWRPAALEYRTWFGQAFAPPVPPEWTRRSDGWTGDWFGKHGGACMSGAVCMDSFRDLWKAYLSNPIDNHEFAFHDRGCQFPVSLTPEGTPRYVHTTGDNVLREDLGGAQALREGVAQVHKLGFHFTFYVEGYIVHETSDLARDGRARRWSIMNKNGTLTGNYSDQGFYHMCPACVEWQDHLATVCSQLVRETRADGVRLDSLGFYFLPCYNPAHHHPHPFVYNDGIRQLLSKVSRAVRDASPEAVITTEAPIDFYASHTQGAIMSFCAGDSAHASRDPQLSSVLVWPLGSRVRLTQRPGRRYRQRGTAVALRTVSSRGVGSVGCGRGESHGDPATGCLPALSRIGSLGAGRRPDRLGQPVVFPQRAG